MNRLHRKNDEAVSPVVGVMLMLVVTIIIAAVVSGFAGGLAGTTQKAPSIAANAEIANTGEWGTSYFDIRVQSVSDPIPSKDLQIITFWEKTNASGTKLVRETKVDANSARTGYKFPLIAGYPPVPAARTVWSNISVPNGMGPGVAEWTTTPSATTGRFPDAQDFGNYTLIAGTTMHTIPAFMTYGETLWCIPPATGKYQYPADYIGEKCPMQVLLGNDWYELRAGDIVNVKLIHKPSGKIIFEQNVQVVG